MPSPTGRRRPIPPDLLLNSPRKIDFPGGSGSWDPASRGGVLRTLTSPGRPNFNKFNSPPNSVQRLVPNATSPLKSHRSASPTLSESPKNSPGLPSNKYAHVKPRVSSVRPNNNVVSPGRRPAGLRGTGFAASPKRRVSSNNNYFGYVPTSRPASSGRKLPLGASSGDGRSAPGRLAQKTVNRTVQECLKIVAPASSSHGEMEDAKEEEIQTRGEASRIVDATTTAGGSPLFIAEFNTKYKNQDWAQKKEHDADVSLSEESVSEGQSARVSRESALPRFGAQSNSQSSISQDLEEPTTRRMGRSPIGSKSSSQHHPSHIVSPPFPDTIYRLAPDGQVLVVPPHQGFTQQQQLPPDHAQDARRPDQAQDAWSPSYRSPSPTAPNSGIRGPYHQTISPQIIPTSPRVATMSPQGMVMSPQNMVVASHVASPRPQVMARSPQIASVSPQMVGTSSQFSSVSPQMVGTPSQFSSMSPQAMGTFSPFSQAMSQAMGTASQFSSMSPPQMKGMSPQTLTGAPPHLTISPGISLSAPSQHYQMGQSPSSVVPLSTNTASSYDLMPPPAGLPSFAPCEQPRSASLQYHPPQFLPSRPIAPSFGSTEPEGGGGRAVADLDGGVVHKVVAQRREDEDVNSNNGKYSQPQTQQQIDLWNHPDNINDRDPFVPAQFNPGSQFQFMPYPHPRDASWRAADVARHPAEWPNSPSQMSGPPQEEVENEVEEFSPPQVPPAAAEGWEAQGYYSEDHSSANKNQYLGDAEERRMNIFYNDWVTPSDESVVALAKQRWSSVGPDNRRRRIIDEAAYSPDATAIRFISINNLHASKDPLMASADFLRFGSVHFTLVPWFKSPLRNEWIGCPPVGPFDDCRPWSEDAQKRVDVNLGDCLQKYSRTGLSEMQVAIWEHFVGNQLSPPVLLGFAVIDTTGNLPEIDPTELTTKFNLDEHSLRTFNIYPSEDRKAVIGSLKVAVALTYYSPGEQLSPGREYRDLICDPNLRPFGKRGIEFEEMDRRRAQIEDGLILFGEDHNFDENISVVDHHEKGYQRDEGHREEKQPPKREDWEVARRQDWDTRAPPPRHGEDWQRAPPPRHGEDWARAPPPRHGEDWQRAPPPRREDWERAGPAVNRRDDHREGLYRSESGPVIRHQFDVPAAVVSHGGVSGANVLSRLRKSFEQFCLTPQGVRDFIGGDYGGGPLLRTNLRAPAEEINIAGWSNEGVPETYHTYSEGGGRRSRPQEPSHKIMARATSNETTAYGGDPRMRHLPPICE